MTISPFAKLFTCLLCLMLLVVPSMAFTSLWDPTVISKFIVFSGFITILAPIAIFYKMFVLKDEVRLSAIDAVLICLGIYLFTQRYFFNHSLGFSVRLMELAGLIIFYFLIKWIISKASVAPIFLLMAVIAGANVQIVIGALQLFGVSSSFNDYSKITGSFFNSGPFGGYITSILPIAIFLFRMVKHSKASVYHPNISQIFIRICNGLIAFNIIGSLVLLPAIRSRASIISLVVSVLFIFRKELISFYRIKLNKPFIKALSAVIIFVMSGLLIGVMILSKKGSTEGRSLILSVTGAIIKNNPLAGIGYDRFRAIYMDRQAEYLRINHDASANKADDVYYAFNEPLQFLAENGVIGCILIIVIIYLLIKKASNNLIPEIAMAGLVSIAVFSCFSYSSQILPIKLNCFLFLALQDQPKNLLILPLKKKLNNVTANVVKIMFFACILISSIGAFFKIHDLKKAYSTWRVAYILYSRNNITESIRQYNNAYNVLHQNGEFLINNAKAVYFSNDYNKTISLLRSAKEDIDNSVLENSLGDALSGVGDFKNAEVAYLKAISMCPGKLYSRYLLVRMYIKTKQIVKAKAMAHTILDMPIKVQSAAVTTIKSEMNEFLKHEF